MVRVCGAGDTDGRPREEPEMSLEQTLNDDERLAQLDLDQLRQLVGLVEYDASGDPFPVSGSDALGWIVGYATQTAHHDQSAFGMELGARPEERRVGEGCRSRWSPDHSQTA